MSLTRNVKFKRLCAVPLLCSDHGVYRTFSKNTKICFFPHCLFRNGAAFSLGASVDDTTDHMPLNVATIGCVFGFFQPKFLSFSFSFIYFFFFQNKKYENKTASKEQHLFLLIPK